MTSTLEPMGGILNGPLENLWTVYEGAARSSKVTALRWSCRDWRLRHLLGVQMRRRVEAQGGAFLEGGWRRDAVRPYQGVLDILGDLAAASLEEDPALVDGYGVALINLLPSLASAPRLSHLTPFRSGLAEFGLRQDRVGLAEFFWRRDASAFLISEQIRCLLDAATAAAEGSGQPSVLWLDDLQWADAKSLELLQLLLRYAARRPVCIVLAGDRLDTFANPALEGVPVLDVGPEHVDVTALDAAFQWTAGQASQRRALEAAAVLCLPYDETAWGRLMADGAAPDPQDVNAWVEQGWLRRVGGRAYRLGSSPLRNALYASLEAGRRGHLHGRGLDIEAADPLCAAWHGESMQESSGAQEILAKTGSDAADIVERNRCALERAWGLSALDLALPWAQRYIAAGPDDGVDGDLLLALLHYDAGQFEAADEHFGLALDSTESVSQRSMLTRLRGNNAVFGLGDLERGRQLLSSVLPRFEAIGLHREACFVRNSIAFTLFREGRLEEAVDLENRSLEQLANSPEPGGLLESLLLLNTGRLHRQKGAADQALEHFEAAGQAGGSDLTPYLLQLLRATLAHLRGQRLEWVEAHRDFFSCLELSRDLSGDGASYPMFRLLPTLPGKLEPGCLTKGDQVELYLHLNLAITSGRAGFGARSRAQFQGIERRWSFLGEPLNRLLESARTAAQPQDGETKDVRAPTLVDFESQRTAAVDRYEELISVCGVDDGVEALAQSLADGETVAWVQPVEGTAAVQSWVLCAPHQEDAARRLSEEFNSYAAPRLRNVWILPQFADAFHGVDGGCPMVLQEAALKTGQVAQMPALAPFHLRVQVADPIMDGALYKLLERLQKKTGQGAVAMVANLVFGWDLATDPVSAIESFLASSVDVLALGDQLLKKRHGHEAPENWLAFRPRLAIKASVISRPGEDGALQHWLAVRSATARRLLKLNAATHAIVELCDGTRSGHAIARQLADTWSADGDLAAQVGQCLRTLHRNKAICFVGAVPP